MRDRIATLLNSPKELEDLYRQQKQQFVDSYKYVLERHPESLLLQAWQARLEYGDTAKKVLSGMDVWVMVVLGLLAGTLLKLPDISGFPADYAYFLPRFAALAPVLATALFTVHLRGWPRRMTAYTCGGLLFLALYLLLLPAGWEDVFLLACAYTPFLLWFAYGALRGMSQWREYTVRIEYIRFSGEVLIHAALLFLGGGILLLLTVGLFELVDISTSWIFEYVAVYGLAAIPMVAVWATDTYSAARRIVPLMARIFAPLLLVLIVAYMGAMAWNFSELLRERHTLLTYNILLLCVLATAVFTLTGRREQGEGRAADTLVLWMLGFTVLLDILALFSISWRVWTFGGFTPNRLAVLGSNVVVLGNVLFLCVGYVKHLYGKGSLEALQGSLARYLNVYCVWVAFMVFIMPWIFRY